MGALSDIPVLLSLAEWVWGTDTDSLVSHKQCLDALPALIFTGGPCLSRLFAKALGVAILFGSVLNKAPVVINILSSLSVEGLSVGSAYGEVIMYSNSGFYNLRRGNPFTAYGETMIVLVQTMVIVGLIWRFREEPRLSGAHMAMALGGYLAYLFVVFQVLSQDNLYILMVSILPVLIYSRGVQILENYRQKQTGAQSLVTTAMNLAGSIVRVFTTIQEVGWDFNILRSYGLSIGLNAVLLAQILLYKSNTETFLKSLKDKKKK